MSKDKMECCVAPADEEACEKKECCTEKKCCKKCCCVCRLLKGICLIGVGFLIGVHFRAIKAWLKGEPLPEAPAWHCWVKKK